MGKKKHPSAVGGAELPDPPKTATQAFDGDLIVPRLPKTTAAFRRLAQRLRARSYGMADHSYGNSEGEAATMRAVDIVADEMDAVAEELMTGTVQWKS